MGISRLSLKYSRKTIVAVVYVGIALVLAVQGATMTWAHVQWFDSMGELEVQVENLVLQVEDQAKAIIYATLRNPTEFNGIRLWSITYVVFINSTQENFSLQGGPDAGEFGVMTARFETEPRMIPARDVLNITFTVSPHPQVVEPLRTFYTLNSGDLREFVGITLRLVSTFGFIEIPHCFELPRNIPTICPGLEAPPRTRFG